jgi:hypothetical protein
MTTLDEAFEEAERIEREAAQIGEYTRQANQAWRDRWPAFCRARGGWGGPLPVSRQQRS